MALARGTRWLGWATRRLSVIKRHMTKSGFLREGYLNIGKLILASLAVFVVFEILTGIVKWLVFEDNLVFSMTVGDLVWSFTFVFIFIKR